MLPCTATRGQFDITALHRAAALGHPEVIRALAELGCDVSRPDSVSSSLSSSLSLFSSLSIYSLSIYYRIDGWMDGWMDGWING